jgi:hypothetical protein
MSIALRGFRTIGNSRPLLLSLPSLVKMLLPSLLFYTAVLFSWAIPLDDDSGILYRFSPASSNETEELLSWAEVRHPSLPQVNR